MEMALFKRKKGKRTKITTVKWLKSLSSQVVITFIINALLVFLWNPGLVGVSANPDAKRLYDDLLSNYNRLIRPVINHTEKVTVKLGVSLSQIVELVSCYDLMLIIPQRFETIEIFFLPYEIFNTLFLLIYV
jgi:hypothetical protein